MNTKEKIKDLLEFRPMTPADLAWEIGISLQALHRHLKKMVAENEIEKMGTPPKVFYRSKPTSIALPKEKISQDIKDFLIEHYAYVDSKGQYWEGNLGFERWVDAIGQAKAFHSLVSAYQKTRKEYLKHFFSKPYISGLEKIKGTFSNVCLTDILYQDFYSIPQFGKTKLGHLLTLGKSGQDAKSIRQIADLSLPIIEQIIHEHSIEAIGFIPHSIPRKISFLHEFRKYLNLRLPQIDIVKAYSGGIPIAQKSLTKLKERIENARNTIFIKERSIRYQKILLIDDAVGSGATMNETACQLIHQFKVSHIYGFTIAGSLKGFDVIAEI